MWVARTATLILLLAAGCTTPGAETSPSASPANPAPSATAAPTANPLTGMAITIKKTGGIAGVNDTLVIDAQGHWTRTTKAGASTSGQLTQDQLTQAGKLATDPRIVAEAAAPKSPTNCADAFLYSVTIASMTVSYSDCGSGSPPAATTELVRYLDQVTH